MTKKDREKIAKFFNEAEDWKEFALEEYKAGEERKEIGRCENGDKRKCKAT